MQISSISTGPEPGPVGFYGPEKYLVRCKVRSEKCLKWHFNTEKRCRACRTYHRTPRKMKLTPRQIQVLGADGLGLFRTKIWD